MKTEITYTLQTPIKYAHKGEQEEGSFVILKAPTSRNMKECADLKQAFFRALPKPGSSGENDSTVDTEDEGIPGDAIMAMIMVSNDVELATVLATGRELLTSGVALVEGEEKLTKPLLDSMSADDLEGMIGEYMGNFILASALQRLSRS